MVPIDPEHPLPQADADVIASSPPPLPSSSFGPQYSSTARSPHSSGMPEDEDFQLQAALEASLDGPRAGSPMPRPRAGPAVAGGSGSARSPGATMGFPMLPPLTVPPPVPPPSTRPTDQPMENPVAASMARNQAMLERMRREQEVALSEHYHEEASRFGGLLGRSYPRAGSHVGDEEEQLRRAIAESEATGIRYE